jgi:succinate dehydrogenase/fumarate reductase-like Fe-S protein
MEETKRVKVQCFRFDPSAGVEPRYQTYEVPLEGAMSVHDCLLYIREKLDPSLAYFINCKLGFCLRCRMRVNGKACFACMTEVDGDITVEPPDSQRVIRDLWSEDV